MGAIKTLLAKVYLTMAGYPLQKGNEYYQLAYEKAKEVIDSGAFSLFADYKDLRALENENSGEHIFMIQREAQDAGAPFHFWPFALSGTTDFHYSGLWGWFGSS